MSLESMAHTVTENVQATKLALAQEKKFIKSLRRSDVVLFIVAAVIALDTIGTIASVSYTHLTLPTIYSV